MNRLQVHAGQKIVLGNPRRYRVVVAGRRWGKTQVAKTALIKAATERSNALVWYVMPTYAMAKQVMWQGKEGLKAAIPRAWIRKIHETRMEIELRNGSRIMLKGADKPDTLRGVGLDFIVIDECQDIKPDTWSLVLQPTIATTGGRVLFIGTPKAYNWLYDIFTLGQRGKTYVDEKGRTHTNEWRSWQFPTRTSPFISPREIEAKKRDMDPKSFRQEFEASFETMSGRVYYAFDRKKHVGDYPFNPRLPIKIGIDFNIDPMSCVIIQEQPNGEVWVVDEAVLPGSNTQEAAQELERRYYRQMNGITVYPDPAGSGRSNTRGESALQVLRESGFTRIIYKKKHPAVADRIASVNRLLESADGQARLFVNKFCPKVIESLEQTMYKAGRPEVDKSAGYEHVTDALGYYTDIAHPVRVRRVGGLSI